MVPEPLRPHARPRRRFAATSLPPPPSHPRMPPPPPPPPVRHRDCRPRWPRTAWAAPLQSLSPLRPALPPLRRPSAARPPPPPGLPPACPLARPDRHPRRGQATTPALPPAAGAAGLGPPATPAPPTTGWPPGQAPPGTLVGQVDLGQLQLAARSAGLPLDWMDRVSRLQQPAASAANVSGFSAKLIDFSRHFLAPNAPLSYTLNPTGQAWLLLAFPDGTEDDALRMFEEDAINQRPGPAGMFRIALAGPAYEGVAVLARGLLGPAPALYSGGALEFEAIFWEEPCATVDARKWSAGCFRGHDQLLPVFLVHISAAALLPCTRICKAR
jgi:hypothetical protein